MSLAQFIKTLRRFCAAAVAGLSQHPGSSGISPLGRSPLLCDVEKILKLEWAPVDLGRRTLTILEQKNGGRDTLPVNAMAMAVLEARAAVRTSGANAVFVNRVGQPRDARKLVRAFHTALQKAGIVRFRFHDLRHTFATLLIQAGFDIYTVQKLGRWKTISMVSRYAHHQLESLRGGAGSLARRQ